MDYFLIYLWTRLDICQELFSIISIGGLIVFAFLIIPLAVTWEEDGFSAVKPYIKYYKIFVFFIILTGFLSLAIPTKKDTLLIYFIPKVAKSEAIQDTMDIVGKLPKVLQKYINDYLDDTEKEVKK